MTHKSENENQNMKNKSEKKLGRPTKFNDELAQDIIVTVATSPYGIRKICAQNPHFPTPETIRVWRYENKSFSAQYAQAKLDQANILAEECLEIADDSTFDIRVNDNGDEVINSEFVARSRLKIDTRKWLASKLLPKQYGDSFEKNKMEEENESLKNEILQLREKLDAKFKREY